MEMISTATWCIVQVAYLNVQFTKELQTQLLVFELEAPWIYIRLIPNDGDYIFRRNLTQTYT